MAQILVVDDEVGIRELLSEILADEGHAVLLAENAAAARRVRAERRPDLVLLDIWMPDTDGISLLKEWAAAGQLTMPVIMMSGHGTIDTAVEATRFGAADFLEKPIALQKLLATVKRVLKHETPAAKPVMTLEAFAHVPLLKEFRKRLEQAAARTRAVLLRCPAGGMAEVCARTLQAPQAPWLDLSAESGPLTQERLQEVAGGLLFVPELPSLGRLQQMNLAFALERLERHKLMLVAASSKSATTLPEAGWDPALVSRLAEVRLALPPLADRGDEVPEIASLLLTLLAERGEVPHKRLSSGALNLLRQQRWPGDDGGWSALTATVKNLALTALDDEISAEEVGRLLTAESSDGDGPGQALAALFGEPLREAREAFEKAYFAHHLAVAGGNMTRVAEQTGLERTHLYRKLKQLGLPVGRSKE